MRRFGFDPASNKKRLSTEFNDESVYEEHARCHGTGISIACSTPTEGCGCSPSRSATEVVGTLKDALGSPLTNHLIVFEVKPEAYPNLPSPAVTIARTDSTGAFAKRVYGISLGRHNIIARVVRASQDTVNIPVGSATFTYEGSGSDTLRVALRLPN